VPNNPSFTPSLISLSLTLSEFNASCASVQSNITTGSTAIIHKGIVYATSPNPTINDTILYNIENTTNYNSIFSGMDIRNAYYIRAFATTVSGPVYSNEITINHALSTSSDTVPPESGSPVNDDDTIMTANSDPNTLQEVFDNLQGDGTEQNPYIITRDWDLQAMSQNLNAYYILGNNIDARGTQYWNTGEGFSPIGNELAPFTGVFNGNGYAILGLTINRDTETRIGLFGSIESSQIKDITLIENTIIGYESVGGLVGYMEGNSAIDNVIITGISWARFGFYGGGIVGRLEGGTIKNGITFGQVHGSGNVIGGLVGYMLGGQIYESTSFADIDGGYAIGGAIGDMEGGQVFNSCAAGNILAESTLGPAKTGESAGGFVGVMSGGDIYNSHSTGNITANNSAGGFVGTAMNEAHIQNSHATGDVTILSNTGGGFVGTGMNEAHIQNSYATGNIIFKNINELSQLPLDSLELSQPTLASPEFSQFGGFIGSNINAVLYNNYSSGEVIYDAIGLTNPQTKGFVGYIEFSDSDIENMNRNNYWNIETSNQTSSLGNALGKTSFQMSQTETFEMWDFNSIWSILEGISLPTLRNSSTCQFTCFE
jgi:hypothetical protein